MEGSGYEGGKDSRAGGGSGSRDGRVEKVLRRWLGSWTILRTQSVRGRFGLLGRMLG